MKDMKKPRFVQILNPKTGKYVKVDRVLGFSFTKRSEGPYARIPIIPVINHSA